MASLFFFGTLLDADVRRIVTGREFALEPAWLAGYRTVFLPSRAYPMLIRHPAGRTEGGMALDVDQEALARLVFYEGDEYELRPLDVLRKADGRKLGCQAFMTKPAIKPGDKPWSLDLWQRRHKAAFLRAVRFSQRCGWSRANPN
jgi:hypothetical protein